ncbi:MAG: hypothetical protein KC635_12160, partial [Myxococcales bacterium]|nr:hypothetical protein [Myxococcales bacterium]
IGPDAHCADIQATCGEAPVLGLQDVFTRASAHIRLSSDLLSFPPALPGQSGGSGVEQPLGDDVVFIDDGPCQGGRDGGGGFLLGVLAAAALGAGLTRRRRAS